MDNNQQVDISTILSSIAGQLQQNRNQLNQVDNAGTHGQRIADAFAAAANAAQNSGTSDAGQQLQIAAQAMRQQGQGKATSFYAQGLEHAAQQFMGKSGIGTNDLGPFLQSFLGGVQQNNPARPGQGTMIDALAPAVSAFTQGQRGGNTEQAMAQALNAAIHGTASTGRQGAVDPGAASATNVLGGIFSAVAPQLLMMLLSNRGGARGQGSGGGLDIGGLLGGLMGGGGAQKPQAGNQMGWLTGLLGGMMGGQGGQSQGGGVDLGGLLGGLAGGMGQNQGGGSDLGGLLGGMLGGSEDDGSQQDRPNSRGSLG